MTLDKFNKKWAKETEAINEKPWMPMSTDEKAPKVRVLSKEDIKRMCEKEKKMRQYTFKLVIEEGSNEFWDELENDGIEEVKQLIKDCLENMNVEVTLLKYENFGS